MRYQTIKIKRIDQSQVELVVALFDQYRVFYQQPSDIEGAHNFLYTRLNNNNSIVFVALAENEREHIPVGFTQLYPRYSSVRLAQDWILNDLYVAATHRRQGIGENLIKTVLAFAQERSATTVELSTATDNLTAQRLYKSMGFEEQKSDTAFVTYQMNVGS